MTMVTDNAAVKAVNAARVLRVYEDQPGYWLGTRAVVRASGVARATVAKHVAELVAEGKLQHNGKGGAGSRHRTPPSLDTVVPVKAPTKKNTVKGKLKRLSEDEERRLRLEREVLAACADAPMRPRGVAVSIVRNILDVQGVMLDLCHRGLLHSRDGYRTFERAA